MSELLTVVEVAKLVKLTPRSIWKLRARHAMPAPVRIGAAVRWPRESIEEWIAAGCPAVGEAREVVK